MKNKTMIAGILALVIIMSAGCIGNETGIEETKVVEVTETEAETGIRVVDFGIINTEAGWTELDKKILFDSKGSEAVLYQAIIYDMKRGILSIDRDELEGEGVTFISHGISYTAFVEFDNIYVVDASGDYVRTSVSEKSGCNVQIQPLYE